MIAALILLHGVVAPSNAIWKAASWKEFEAGRLMYFCTPPKRGAIYQFDLLSSGEDSAIRVQKIDESFKREWVAIVRPGTGAQVESADPEQVRFTADLAKPMRAKAVLTLRSAGAGTGEATVDGVRFACKRAPLPIGIEQDLPGSVKDAEK